MSITFGENPERPKPRSWSVGMGFSWSEWLDDKGLILSQPPQLNRQYEVRFPGDFVAHLDETITLRWLPWNSSINGIEQSNVEELTQLRFATGTVVASGTTDKTIVFQPDKIVFPMDLLELEPRIVDETDTLAECQRWENSIGRYKHVGFDMQSNVTSEYVFLDGQLVMLEHTVFGDAHFWIGNGTLSPSIAAKVLIGNGG